MEPEYKGRVGLTALNSTLGMAFMAEIARLNGGSESNLEPAFKALRELLPNVGAISANLGAHATLFQQEQIDIAPYNFNFVETLKGKGVDVEFVVPDSGPVAWRTSLHIVKGAARPELAFQWIEGAITPEVQTEESKPPYDVIPTHTKVPMTAVMAAKIARTPADLYEAHLPRLEKAQRGARLGDRSLQPRDQGLARECRKRRRCGANRRRTQARFRMEACAAAGGVHDRVFRGAAGGADRDEPARRRRTLRDWSLAQYAKFLGDGFNLRILGETLWLGAKATLVCLLFGYPLAWLASRASPRVQSLLHVSWSCFRYSPASWSGPFRGSSSSASRACSTRCCSRIGLIDEPLKLLFSETGVVMVLAQVQLPLIVLPLMTTLSRIDPNLSSASAALGAGEWRTFFKVTLPLSVPGMIAGCILAFAACVTAFVTQTLIGGARLVYMPLFIYQQATGAQQLAVRRGGIGHLHDRRAARGLRC